MRPCNSVCSVIKKLQIISYNHVNVNTMISIIVKKEVNNKPILTTKHFAVLTAD